MPIVAANGTVLTKAALLAKTTVVTQPAVRVFTEDVYESFSLPGESSKESRKRKKFFEGQVVPEALIDALPDYVAGTVASVSPSTALPAAGGTVVTIKGTGLQGVTSVTFGGTAGTALKKISAGQIKVTTPAKAAGTHAVVVVDDGGNISAGNSTFV